MPSTQTPECQCPSCAQPINGATNATGQLPPRPGDWGVCVSCGQFLRYCEDMTVYAVSDAVVRREPQRIQDALFAARSSAIGAYTRMLVGHELETPADALPIDKIAEALGISAEEEVIIQRAYQAFNTIRNYGWPAEYIRPAFTPAKNLASIVLQVDDKVANIPCGEWRRSPKAFQDAWNGLGKLLPRIAYADIGEWANQAGEMNMFTFFAHMQAEQIKPGPEWTGPPMPTAFPGPDPSLN